LPTYKGALTPPFQTPLPINRIFQTAKLKHVGQHFFTLHMINSNSSGYGRRITDRQTDSTMRYVAAVMLGQYVAAVMFGQYAQMDNFIFWEYSYGLRYI
jgi:hypothetical protein